MNKEGKDSYRTQNCQAPTEARSLEMAARAKGGANPLVSYFQNDTKVLELETDLTAAKSFVTQIMLRDASCMAPCLWPTLLVHGTPCGLLCGTMPSLERAREAHHLVLRRDTLLYQVDRYPLAASFSNGASLTASNGYAKCCPISDSGEAGGFVEVFPLQDITAIEVEPGIQKGCCGAAHTLDTLTVHATSGARDSMLRPLAVAAIDAPLRGEEFCAAVRERMGAVKASGEQLEPAIAAAYAAYLSRTSPLGGTRMEGQQNQQQNQQQQPQPQQQQQQQQQQQRAAMAATARSPQQTQPVMPAAAAAVASTTGRTTVPQQPPQQAMQPMVATATVVSVQVVPPQVMNRGAS
jgi:hypothetical protein